MNDENERLAHFLALSAVLTGFEEVDLQGTGLVVTYYQTFTGIIRPEICEELWKLTSKIVEGNRHDEAAMNAAIRREILASVEFGPLATNIIQMWYLGNWVRMPKAWSAKFGTSTDDDNKVISALAYKQSLIFDVMAAHPPGAKQPGFGSWAERPAAVRI